MQEVAAVADAERKDAEVVEMVDYLRETLREMDEGIAEMTQRRQGIAMRLAVIEAATTPAVRDAIADFDRRAEAGEGYEGQDATALLTEAHRRYGS